MGREKADGGVVTFDGVGYPIYRDLQGIFDINPAIFMKNVRPQIKNCIKQQGKHNKFALYFINLVDTVKNVLHTNHVVSGQKLHRVLQFLPYPLVLYYTLHVCHYPRQHLLT